MKFQLGMWAFVGAVTLAAAAYGQAPDLSDMDIVLRSVPSGPVATVNDQSISGREFSEMYRRELERFAARAGRAPDDAERLAAGFGVLGALIENEVLWQEAQRRKLAIPADELQRAWKKEVEITLAQVRDNGPLTEEQLLEKAGTTREEAIEQLRRALLIERVRAEIIEENKVTVSDAEVQAEVDKFLKANQGLLDGSPRYHIKHIIIRPDAIRGKSTEQDWEKARKEAEAALGAIRSGRSFDAVAREVSEGPQKERGGDLGMLTVAQLPPFLMPTISQLKPGEISGVVKSDYGFHIVQLVDSAPGEKADIGDIKPRVKQALVMQKGESVVKEFVQKTTERPGVLSVYLSLDRELALRPDLVQKLEDLPRPQ